MPTWLLVSIFAVLRSLYVSLFGGVLLFGAWNLIGSYTSITNYFLSYTACFGIIFMIDIIFSIVRVSKIFKD